MFMLFDDKVEADSVQKTGILATQSRCYYITNRLLSIFTCVIPYKKYLLYVAYIPVNDHCNIMSNTS